MQDLTKTMNPGEFGKFWRRLEGLPDPSDYYHGVDGLLPVNPRQILMFIRSHPLHEDQPSLHYRYVLCICLSHDGAIIIDGRYIPMSAGRAVLVHPYQSHYFAHCGDPAPCWVFVTFELSHPGPLEAWRCRAVGLDPSEDFPLLERLGDAWCRFRRQGGQADGRTGFWLGELLCQLFVRLSVDCQLPDRSAPAGPEAGVVAKVCEYVSAHRDQPINIDAVAEAVGYCGSHLRAVFRGQVGMSLGRFLRSMRIEYALRLMQREQLNVSQVARACGFSTVGSFSRCFHQVMGVTPSRFGRRGG